MSGQHPSPTGPQSDSARLVGALADFGSGSVATAGGKGANLGELVRAGFAVPDGFVVTTAGYAQLLSDTGLGGTLAGLLATAADGEQIRQAFAATTMPAALRNDIVAAYARLGRGAVAVRSSATAEDLPGATFAGQQDTFLNVVGEAALLQAVAGCWASLWTDRAISYRARQQVVAHQVAIAVVVQVMVPADTAGVLFTANPVTGRRDELVVDASGGLGEAVVSGLVTPEHYVLDRGGQVKEWTPGGQEAVVQAVAGGGTREATGVRSSGPMLSSDQLVQLALTGQRAAAHFGRPQDIEWAIADGAVWLLQARPMTALAPEPVRLNFFQRKLGPFYVEMFQVRPYPLDVSGWLTHGIIEMLERMAGSVGVVFPAVSELLPEEDGVVVRLVPPVPRPTLRTLFAPVSIARRARRFHPAQWTADERFAVFLAEVAALQTQDVEQLGWQQLVGQAREAFRAMGRVTDLRVSYLPGSFLPMLSLRLLLLLLGKRSLGSALIAGAETRTSQANRSLARLADQVREDETLRQAFDRLEAAELATRLAGDPAFADFDQSFRDFLAEYGHRETISVVLSSAPTWSDAPEVVLGLVKVLLGERPVEVDQTGSALRELTAHPALGNPWLRRQVLAAVDGAKTGMAFREDSHFHATMVLPPLRRALLEMGRRLRTAGVLDDATDVFHLRFDELSEMTDGAGLTPAERERYRTAVLARAARRQELAAFPLLDLDTLFGRRKADGDALLTGMGTSRGTATGSVRVIRGPSDFGTLRSGEVLVCPYTNPSWTPLFQRAVAVVVDAGGMGSHAAIVAREYGIPAVMGTGNGTGTLTDGQLVTVDGTTGRVVTAPDSR